MDSPTLPNTASAEANDLPGLGHNNPPPYDPDVLRELGQRTDAFVKASDAWLKTEITSDTLAGQLADQITGLRKVWKQVDTARTAQKKPHLDAGKAVDEAYKPLLTMLEKSADALKKLADGYAKKKRAEEEARKAEEKRKADQIAEEARLKAMDAESSGSISAQVEAEEAQKRAAEAQKQAAAPVDTRIRSATGAGRTLAERRIKVVTVENYRQLFLHYQAHPQVRELLHRLATADARAASFPEGGTIPGCTITTELTIA